MKKTVSFKTASRLKDAGFPQPDFQFGQLWMTNDERHFAFVGTAQMELFKQHYAGSIIFLPTATDILAQLGDNYNLTICSQFFRVEQMKADEYFVINYWQSDNPAEAAALAWLAALHDG